MIAVTDRPIQVDAVLASVEGHSEGAVVLFVGRVRDHNRGQDVTRLEYEAYGEMAVREMEALAGEARAEHGAVQVAMVHRHGRLELGDAAVAIAVSSAHRPEAFAACQWLIDTLKQRVPIWKKEIYADGGQWLADRP